MQFAQQFQTSQLWKILLPLALASDTLGLYDIIPEPIKVVMSIPFVNLLLLAMFVVEAGADLQMAAALFLVMAFFYIQKNGMQTLFQPRAKEGYRYY